MQYEKNPNGGYARPNQYGLFGVIDVTPELMREAAASGKLAVSIGSLEERVNQQGEQWQSARVTLKPYTPNEAARPAAPAHNNYAQASNYGQAPAPAPQAQAAAPPHHQGAAVQSDEIPW